MKYYCKNKSLRIRFINWIFKGTNIMSTLEEITATAESLKATIEATDAKLEEIKAFIAGLSLPQDKLDALGALLESAKSEAATVLAKTDALDEPVVSPTPETPTE